VLREPRLGSVWPDTLEARVGLLARAAQLPRGAAAALVCRLPVLGTLSFTLLLPR
jgi:hypothetical protein